MLAPRPIKLRLQRDINLRRIPLSLAAIALFAVALDMLDHCKLIHIPSSLTMGSIDDARAILGAMMGSTVLSMVATLFGPRLLYRWVTQATIGLWMGTFIYVCLCFLVTHQDADSRFIPQLSLITSWVLIRQVDIAPRVSEPARRALADRVDAIHAALAGLAEIACTRARAATHVLTPS